MIDAAERDELESVFGLIADDTRIDILLELWERQIDGDPVAGFSDIRRAVGARDSGGFNYHLDRLRPRFVRKVDDGYTLSYAGRQVVTAAASGVLTVEDDDTDPVVVGDCLRCGGDIVAEFGTGTVRIDCRDCGELTGEFDAPPNLVAACDEERLPALLWDYWGTQFRQAVRGFCPHCGGRMSVERPPGPEEFPRLDDADGDVGADDRTVAVIVYACEGCRARIHTGLLQVLIDHPATVAFCFEHGFDPRETPSWDPDLEPLLDHETAVVSDDPLRIETTLSIEGEALVLRLDGDMNVREYRREGTE
jgi:hypothetical protein